MDTGGYTFTDRPLNDRCKLLDEKLVENGCTPETLGCVFLTHGDIDHITNCQYVKEKYNAKIFIHKEDIRLTKDLTAEKIFSLKAYDLSAEILYLPGHTMGSIGILFDNGSSIIGDTLSNTKRPDYAMNAIDFKLLKKVLQDLEIETLKRYILDTEILFFSQILNINSFFEINIRKKSQVLSRSRPI